MNQDRFIIICGHYGTGKTNYSLNLAKKAVESGEKVTLVDLDLVNPYFRSSDYGRILEKQGVRLIAPSYANTNVDVPTVPAEVFGVFDTEGTVIIDVGGDDVGSTVLGRFHEQLKNVNYEMRYVINRYRSMTTEAEEAVQILREIETVSRCHATSIVNNSHLKQDTTIKTITDSLEFANETARMTGLGIVETTVPTELFDKLEDGDREKFKGTGNNGRIVPVDILVRTVWE